MSWVPAQWPEHGRNEPAFLRLGKALVADIREGRLAAGEKLPSTRKLASQLGVHRNTVIAAYDELTAQGWIRGAQGQGTFVRADLPQKISVSQSSPVAPHYCLPVRSPLMRVPLEPGVLSLGGGLPDTRLVSCPELSRTIRRVLRRGHTLLDYGSPFGVPRLRSAIAQMLRETRGIAVSAENVLITRGSQMGIYLLGQALLRRGDAIAVESFGYRAAFQAFRIGGVKLLSVPVDEEGMQVERLEKIHRQTPLRAVYLTPHHQYPTLVTLSAGRRMRLQNFARKNRIAIIEDDYDHEFHYEGRPVLPMASQNSSGNVIYLGTLSKVLAPGLRIGYVVAPPAVLEPLAALRSHIDSHGDGVMETAIAEWIEEGELARHARKVRRAYLARRQALVELLERDLPDALSYAVPTGGMAIWARSRTCSDVNAWVDRAMELGVRVSPASYYRLDGKNLPFVRLGYARLSSEELSVAVERLAEAHRVS